MPQFPVQTAEVAQGLIRHQLVPAAILEQHKDVMHLVETIAPQMSLWHAHIRSSAVGSNQIHYGHHCWLKSLLATKEKQRHCSQLGASVCIAWPSLEGLRLPAGDKAGLWL